MSVSRDWLLYLDDLIESAAKIERFLKGRSLDAAASGSGGLIRNLQKRRIPLGFMKMEKDIQISAFVSPATREALERHVRASGVKKGHLVEQALQHYLIALEQLPADVVVHPRLVVTRKSGEAILKQTRTGKPTKALRDLMRDAD